MAEQTLNIPQIIAVVLVGFLAIRWFLSSSSPQGGSNRRGGRPINPAHVDQIHQIFPQLDRRTIMWDLQRNGGSVQATTEIVLSGRQLPQPPPSFQPEIPTSTTARAQQPAAQGDKKSALPDLITRYNLSSKVSKLPEFDVPDNSAQASKNSGWSQNKVERSDILKRRREEMILAARRKMEAKDKQGGGQS